MTGNMGQGGRGVSEVWLWRWAVSRLRNGRGVRPSRVAGLRRNLLILFVHLSSWRKRRDTVEPWLMRQTSPAVDMGFAVHTDGLRAGPMGGGLKVRERAGCSWLMGQNGCGRAGRWSRGIVGRRLPRRRWRGRVPGNRGRMSVEMALRRRRGRVSIRRSRRRGGWRKVSWLWRVRVDSLRRHKRRNATRRCPYHFGRWRQPGGRARGGSLRKGLICRSWRQSHRISLHRGGLHRRSLHGRSLHGRSLHRMSLHWRSLHRRGTGRRCV